MVTKLGWSLHTPCCGMSSTGRAIRRYQVNPSHSSRCCTQVENNTSMKKECLPTWRSSWGYACCSCCTQSIGRQILVHRMWYCAHKRGQMIVLMSTCTWGNHCVYVYMNVLAWLCSHVTYAHVQDHNYVYLSTWAWSRLHNTCKCRHNSAYLVPCLCSCVHTCVGMITHICRHDGYYKCVLVLAWLRFYVHSHVGMFQSICKHNFRRNCADVYTNVWIW